MPLGRYGVLIAVIRRVALISSTEAVVDFIVEFVHALDATHCGELLPLRCGHNMPFTKSEKEMLAAHLRKAGWIS